MKYLITLFIIVLSTSAFAQNTGFIVGKIMDKELDKAPLAFANVSVKGSSLQSTTDTTGVFIIENLKDGLYTLVFSFPGYQTQEVNVNITSGKSTEITLAMKARTISLNQLALAQSTSQKKNKPLSVLN